MAGIISYLLSFTRTTRRGAPVSVAKVDRGGSDFITAEHFSSPGDDSHPLPDDYAVIVMTPGNSRAVAVGYLDPANEQKAAAGEKRIYARGVDGKEIVDLWLKNDGSAVLQNDKGAFTLSDDGSITGASPGGSFVLNAAGRFLVNGAEITPTGDFVDSSGRVLRTHTHSQGNDSDGDTQQNTDQPI